jgi:hypothetical protein
LGSNFFLGGTWLDYHIFSLHLIHGSCLMFATHKQCTMNSPNHNPKYNLLRVWKGYWSRFSRNTLHYYSPEVRLGLVPNISNFKITGYETRINVKFQKLLGKKRSNFFDKVRPNRRIWIYPVWYSGNTRHKILTPY